MIDHIILTVSEIERSLAFYEASLAPLNIRFFLPYKGKNGHPDLWGFGDGKRAFFWLKQGKPDPEAIHWGFMAETNSKVEEFYKAAMAAGARDNISPRSRVEYTRSRLFIRASDASPHLDDENYFSPPISLTRRFGEELVEQVIRGHRSGNACK